MIDASAAVGWLVPSQASAAAKVFLISTASEEYIAPFVFEWEVRNVLISKARSGQLPGGELDNAFKELEDFAIACAEPVPAGHVLPLARSEGISLFDASYLSLALETGAALASRDGGLLAAAARLRVPAFDLASR